MTRIGRNGLKAHLRSGGKVVNAWCSISSTITAETVAAQGFDSVTVDLQHGLVDYQTSLSMLQAIDRFDVPSVCRVPWNEPSAIMKALDAGFSAIICPMINSESEARMFAASARYAPLGMRSYGPTRALPLYGADYATRANEFVTTFAMIETRAALENLSAILSVPEIDGVYIGPADLSLSLGFEPSLVTSESAVIDAIAHIRTTATAAGKIAGIHCASGDAVRDAFTAGFGFASLSTDMRLFTQALSSALGQARKASAKMETVSGQY